ncbi:enoyl-CoA hydratase/isomerase family protein [Metabacillus arenae]|uniref:Enoyl-CoA hydratase/isomerase family protein n=1 Tax=Metabacillus arenae TaxID=2771434 RepID=A0A926NB54_9BACI|nr:enoyl-CoA hydratase-related protein [Metabacillus arenae]MBD1380992.1 enoyl-CoA hydratase/isomerase family protein [Metabacillus arenae]
MENQAVLYEVQDQVAIITLNEPDSRNALSSSIRKGLWDAFSRLRDDSNAKVGIVTGIGKAFCAGAHLKEFAENKTAVPDRNIMPMLNRNIWVNKPVIAAVNGDALGGGFLLAQTCDLAIAADNARFGMPEARWGRGAPWSVPLLNMIPQRIWMEMALTGQLIDANRAYSIGLLNDVVPIASLMERSMELAQSIAAGAPLTIAATHKMVYLATEMGRTAAWETADAIFEKVYESEDALEGPLSFKEKRPPNWKGR